MGGLRRRGAAQAGPMLHVRMRGVEIGIGPVQPAALAVTHNSERFPAATIAQPLNHCACGRSAVENNRAAPGLP
jgi:hypothetical protein